MDTVVTTYPDYRIYRQPEIGEASSTGDSYNSHNKYYKSPSSTCERHKGNGHPFPGPAVVVHDMLLEEQGERVVLTYDRFLNLRYAYVKR
jgi:hypothetical protein